MDDKTRQQLIWLSSAVAMAFAYVLYQGMVVQPRAVLENAEKVRLDGIEYSNTQKRLLNTCLATAEVDYWAWIELNMTKQDDGSYWGSNYNWDKAADSKQTDEDSCHRQFSNE